MTTSPSEHDQRRPALAQRLGRYAAAAFVVLAAGFLLALAQGRASEPLAWRGVSALWHAQTPLSERVLLAGVLLLLGLPLVRNASLLREQDQAGGRLRQAMLLGMSAALIALAAWQLA